MRYFSIIDSPLGPLTLVSSESALTNIHFQLNTADLSQIKNEPEFPILQAAKEWLDTYFRGEMPARTVPLSPIGTAFQQLVWDELKKIPYGNSVSYGRIAKAIAFQTGVEKISARAVGGAVGRNPIPILIPCHRVLGADGSLTGFTGGIEKKVWMLELEQIPYKK